jgi:ubiquinone biosynthesis accessory factor UbiJ
MLQNLQRLLVPAVVERLVLVVNHVLSSEPVAMQRLAPHQGRVIALEWMRWPSWLPAAPVLQFRITPPGLLEWCGAAAAAPAALAVQIDASNPALVFTRALAGEPPPVTIAGDAALATEIQWLVDNLRWDVQADLEHLFGPVVAHQLGRLGSSLAAALRGLSRSPWFTGDSGGAARPRA